MQITTIGLDIAKNVFQVGPRRHADYTDAANVAAAAADTSTDVTDSGLTANSKVDHLAEYTRRRALRQMLTATATWRSNGLSSAWQCLRRRPTHLPRVGRWSRSPPR
jgi:hypothetical protein